MESINVYDEAPVIEKRILDDLPIGSQVTDIMNILNKKYGIDVGSIILDRYDEPIKVSRNGVDYLEYSNFYIHLCNKDISDNKTDMTIYVSAYFYFNKSDELLGLSVVKTYEER